MFGPGSRVGRPGFSASRNPSATKALSPSENAPSTIRDCRSDGRRSRIRAALLFCAFPVRSVKNTVPRAAGTVFWRDTDTTDLDDSDPITDYRSDTPRNTTVDSSRNPSGLFTVEDLGAASFVVFSGPDDCDQSRCRSATDFRVVGANDPRELVATDSLPACGAAAWPSFLVRWLSTLCTLLHSQVHTLRSYWSVTGRVSRR